MLADEAVRGVARHPLPRLTVGDPHAVLVGSRAGLLLPVAVHVCVVVDPTILAIGLQWTHNE